MKCAKIVGQAMAGVPLWQLGPESRHPGGPYIVFPGEFSSKLFFPYIHLTIVLLINTLNPFVLR